MWEMLEEITSKEERAFVASKAERPFWFNFFLAPYDSEELLSTTPPRGTSVITGYSQVDWKGLSEQLQARLGCDMPPGVQVYIGDDAADAADMSNVAWDQGRRLEENNEPLVRASYALGQIGARHYQDGVISLARRGDMHLNPEREDGGRHPAGGIVVAIRFDNIHQADEHLPLASDRLFGTRCDINLPPLSGLMETGAPAPEIKEWLEEQFGVRYPSRLFAFYLGFVWSD